MYTLKLSSLSRELKECLLEIDKMTGKKRKRKKVYLGWEGKSVEREEKKTLHLEDREWNRRMWHQILNTICLDIHTQASQDKI